MKPGTYAVFETSMGSFTIELFEQEAPNTVANFTGLADGSKAWSDPRTGAPVEGKPFYDGLIFHRIIDGFMIQGGCPAGSGRGGPGYRFADEFAPSLTHDREGRLSMANSGPNTNGSQFFITLGPTPHLNGRHSVFGQVVEGLDIVRIIGQTPTDGSDRPVTPVVLSKVEIRRIPG